MGVKKPPVAGGLRSGGLPLDVAPPDDLVGGPGVAPDKVEVFPPVNGSLFLHRSGEAFSYLRLDEVGTSPTGGEAPPHDGDVPVGLAAVAAIRFAHPKGSGPVQIGFGVSTEVDGVVAEDEGLPRYDSLGHLGLL